MDEEAPKVAKIIIIGESAVGKTCIAKRYFENSFQSKVSETIGAGYFKTQVEIQGEMVDFVLWDTAGAERYRALTPLYFSNAAAAIVAYAINDRKTFEELDSFIQLLNEKTENILIYIVGNKNDLEEEREVEYIEGLNYSKKINAEHFLEVSALTGEGVNSLFESIICSPHIQFFQNAHMIDHENVKHQSSDKGCC